MQKLYSVVQQDDYVCFLGYLTTLSQLHKLDSSFVKQDASSYFLDYLTAFSQLHKLQSNLE
jgi:hypothetical protein